MKGILEGMVGIIVLILMLTALFPEVIKQIVDTVLAGLFVGFALLVIGVAIWAALYFFGNN